MGKGQIYSEVKTLNYFGSYKPYLYDEISLRNYIWYNEDGTFRASSDQYKATNVYSDVDYFLMKESNYDAFGNLIEELTYKKGDRNNLFSFVEYYYELEQKDRRLPYAINNNGIIHYYEYNAVGNVKKVYNIVNANSSNNENEYEDNKIIYEYANDLNTLKTIKFESKVNTQNEYNQENEHQIIEQNDILINNYGLLKEIKNDYLQYQYDYDELFRLKSIRLNNKLIYGNEYYPVYLENKNVLRRIWLDNHLTINLDEQGNVKKLNIGKTMDGVYSVKTLELCDSLDEAIAKLYDIDSDNEKDRLTQILKLAIYTKLKEENILEKEKYVVDKFSNTLQVYFKNNLIDRSTYKLIDGNNVLKQSIKYLQNETIYDIIDGRVKYKFFISKEEYNNYINLKGSKILTTKYYLYKDIDTENEDLIQDDFLSKDYKYDNYGRLIASQNKKTYYQNIETFLCKDFDDADFNGFNKVDITHHKTIEFKHTPITNSTLSDCYMDIPSKICYEFSRDFNYRDAYTDPFESVSTNIKYEVELDDFNRIIKTYTEGNYFINPVLIENNSQVSILPNTEITYSYDDKNQLSQEVLIISNKNAEDEYVTQEFTYNYTYNNGELSGVISNEFIKSFEYKELNENDKSLVPNSSKKLEYNYYKDNILKSSKNIYFDFYGNIERINDYKLTFGYNNLLEKYYKEDSCNSEEDELLSVFYSYDGSGKRIKKDVEYNNKKYSIHYYYDNDKLICQNWFSVIGNDIILSYKFIFIYDLEGLTGIKVFDYENNTDFYNNSYFTNGVNYFFVKDHLNNVTGIVRDSNLLCIYQYDAWGNHEVINKINVITSLSYLDEFVIQNNPFRYRGYYYDIETNLFLVSSRYYSPELCRWISPDDIEYLDPESVNGLNLYCYCKNDPVNYVDPDGHFPIATLLIATLIGAAIGTAIEVGKQIYDGGNWNWDPSTWNYWEIGKGALIGAASGLAYGLGGIAGGIVRGSVKALTIAGKALTVSQSVGVLLGVAASTSFIAGFGGYALHTAGTPEDDFNFFKGISEGLGQSVKGLLSFGTGGMFGGAGVWKFGQKIPVGKQIVNAMYRGAARFAANYIPNYVIDGIF